MFEFSESNVDISQCKINKLEIDKIENNQYHLNCDYILKFKNIKTGDYGKDQYINNNSFKCKYNQDVKSNSSNIDDKLDEYINSIQNKPGKVFDFISNNFNVNLPKYEYNRIISGEFPELENKKKVKGIEYDYRKINVKYVTIIYEDDSNVTVELKEPVNNNNVQMIVPDMSLPQLYSYFEDWLAEDYESTIDMANEIFGFDLESLKGADVK